MPAPISLAPRARGPPPPPSTPSPDAHTRRHSGLHPHHPPRLWNDSSLSGCRPATATSVCVAGTWRQDWSRHAPQASLDRSLPRRLNAVILPGTAGGSAPSRYGRGGSRPKRALHAAAATAR
eukprot:scaffold21173_cov89-Isochrysis_galbana.AAC.1